MAAETQALLDQLKTPTLITPVQVRNAIGAFGPKVGEMSRQVAHMSQLLSSADITEADAGLRQLMVEGTQKLGALKRQAGELERELRETVQTYRELVDWEQRFRPAASAAGYTV